MTRTLTTVAFASLVVIVGCSSNASPPQTGATKESPVLTVKSFVVGDRAQLAALRLPGELRAHEEARLGFRVGGKLVARRVDMGAPVKRGQLLAELDPQDFVLATGTQRASLDAAKADQALAAQELERVQRLREQSFVSQAQVDRQQASFDAAQARVKALQAQVAQTQNQATYTRLVADSDGLVTGVDAEPGQVVQPGQSVVRVAKSGHIEAVVQVPEARLSDFRKSASFAVEVSALDNKVFTATLAELSPQAEPLTRTFMAKLALTETDPALTLGMSITVMQTQEATDLGFVVPASALYTRSDQPNVWVIDAGSSTVKLTPVATAGLTGDQVIIRSGLKSGDRIVAAGGNLLIAGQKVRPVEIKS